MLILFFFSGCLGTSQFIKSTDHLSGSPNGSRWSASIRQIHTEFLSQDFLRRSEAAFQALHGRVLLLEQQQASQGPSDEQVERVLRKILAERFGDTRSLRVESPSQQRNAEFFVKPQGDDSSVPRGPFMDPAMLAVHPEAVPSKAWSETFDMLERGLGQYPQIDDAKPVLRDATSKDDDFKRPDIQTDHGQTR